MRKILSFVFLFCLVSILAGCHKEDEKKQAGEDIDLSTIPGMVTRNVTRTAVKIAAQQAANNISTGDATVDLLIQLGVLIYNTASTITCEADTRCWTTLPECVQLARLKRAPGASSVRIARSGGSAMDVALPSCPGPVLVWVTDVGAYAQVSVLPVSPQASASPSARVASLVGVGDGRFR